MQSLAYMLQASERRGESADVALPLQSYQRGTGID